MISRFLSIRLLLPALLWLEYLLLAGTPLAQGAETVRVQLKWLHQFQFAGYYAAIEQGYYREAGLDVVLLEGQPEIDPAKEVLGGRVEYGVGTPEILLARAEGKPLVVLGVIFQHSPYIFLTLKDSGVTDISGLSGRRVMIEPQAAELYAYLNREQMPVNGLRLIPHTFSPQALVRHEADVMSAYVTTEPYELRKAGIAYSSFNPRSSGVDFYGDLLFTTEKQIHRKPAQVRAFRDATLRGWDYAFKHEAETIDLILRRYSPGHDRGALEYEAREMRQLVHPEIIPIGYMYEGRWNHIAETYQELGMLKGTYSLRGFLYDPEPKRDLAWLYWFAGIMGILAFLSMGIALPLWRMNRKMAAARDYAESSNRAKERFVAMVSHELRTPMNGVLGFTSLLQRTPLNPEQAEYVHLIETSTTSLSKLISDLLDFSRIEAGRTEFERLPFDLRVALEDIVDFFGPMAEEKGIQLKYDPREPLPRFVLGDTARLRQILVNLLGNALKFTEIGTVTLGVAPEPVLEEAQRTAGWLQFIVRDSGPGMSEVELARAFEPYAQADASIRRRYGGTGLGLTISRRLAEQMGGQLNLSSTPGKGTLAVLRLPLEATEAPAKPLPPPDPPPEKKAPEKMRILIAEDDKISARLMLALVRKLGHEPATVENGRLAVEYWQRERPDLIFMDMQMPEMGGLEAIEAIRKLESDAGHSNPPSPRTWLIALSASAQDQIKLDCLAAGADTYLTKPITLTGIQSALDELMEE